MIIGVTGNVGGSPDGNPEHGSPTPIDQQFQSIDDALAFILQKTKEFSGQGNLTLYWVDGVQSTS